MACSTWKLRHGVILSTSVGLARNLSRLGSVAGHCGCAFVTALPSTVGDTWADDWRSSPPPQPHLAHASPLSRVVQRAVSWLPITRLPHVHPELALISSAEPCLHVVAMARSSPRLVIACIRILAKTTRPASSSRISGPHFACANQISRRVISYMKKNRLLSLTFHKHHVVNFHGQSCLNVSH